MLNKIIYRIRVKNVIDFFNTILKEINYIKSKIKVSAIVFFAKIY